MPDRREIERIQYSVQRLKDAFKGAGKRTNQETFCSKVLATDSLPSFTLVVEMVKKMKSEIGEYLDELEILFNKNLGKVNVAPTLVNGRKSNLGVMHLT